MPRDDPYKEFRIRLGIKIFGIELEECTCLKCGQPANICSIEILVLFFFAGVYLFIVSVILMTLAFSTRNDTSAVGQRHTGTQRSQAPDLHDSQSDAHTHPRQSTPVAGVSNFDLASRLRELNGDEDPSTSYMSGEVLRHQHTSSRPVAPLVGMSFNTTATERVRSRSTNFEASRLDFPGHNTPASHGEDSFSSGYSRRDRSCPIGRQIAGPHTPSNASRRVSSKIIQHNLQPAQYWV
ncbi:uncharacterized protein LOC110830846 isoform X2 [Zootermopsis nevadensis]|uniref:uncharacterized protein LOC110830846 isoform X2 n=1 Tax=Zootermopsis nevadensis TaxID=136037 RepID=UPI000B8E899E|nr:uncharacterized protein LOC110830846 isoform X2 [Zootermopsis nevadensis]